MSVLDLSKADEKAAKLTLKLRAASGYSSDETHSISTNQWAEILLIVADAEGRRKMSAAPDLLEACEAAIPKGVCLTNKNIPDGFTVALDCTMGDLRKIAAAIAKATGAA